MGGGRAPGPGAAPPGSLGAPGGRAGPAGPRAGASRAAAPAAAAHARLGPELGPEPRSRRRRRRPRAPASRCGRFDTRRSIRGAAGGGGGRGARRGLGAGARCPGDGRPYKGMGGRARRPAPAGGAGAERGAARLGLTLPLPLPLRVPAPSAPAPALTPARPRPDPGSGRPQPFRSLARIPFKALPSASCLGGCLAPLPSRRCSEAPIPGTCNNGGPVAPRGRGACPYAMHTLARSRPDTLGHCTVAKWIVFASSSKKAWPGGRLDCRCLSSQLPSACKTSHNPTQALDRRQPALIKHLLNAPRLLLAGAAGAPSAGLVNG
ncbi:translation initiation factor IF-2-like [Pipistrellus kuhlii]|uniref:translation initiation factor IF-2-like n=1 Tax=Pipistrellus kuhlii TaxID=59472 RepID=UPI001E26F36F|nr:translation initiation factor IF-2-like [Pipistrellus kuhlii]